MKVRITSMQGNTRDITLQNKQEVYDFIDLYKSTLLKNQRVKITCDLLGIDGYLQGVAQKKQGVVVGAIMCSLLFLLFLFQIVHRTSLKNIQICGKMNLWKKNTQTSLQKFFQIYAVATACAKMNQSPQSKPMLWAEKCFGQTWEDLKTDFQQRYDLANTFQ